MKLIVILISLACFSHGALADDLTTPTPTPVYPIYLGRPGSVRRLEQIDRRRAIQAEAETKAQTRTKERSNRRSAAAVQAQAREAARAREQAQRQVAAENRIESRNETSHPNSDLMTRMGFSEKEIAAQKAREESAKSAANGNRGAMSPAEHQPQEHKPASDTGAAVDHPTSSPAKANGVATPGPSA